MTERAQNADFRRKPQIFADSPLLLEIPAFGGRRKPLKTAGFCRKPQIFAENRRKPQIGLCHLRCVTFSSALQVVEAHLSCFDLFCSSTKVGSKDSSMQLAAPTSSRIKLISFVSPRSGVPRQLQRWDLP